MTEIICDTTVWHQDRSKDFKGMLIATFINLGDPARRNLQPNHK